MMQTMLLRVTSIRQETIRHFWLMMFF